MPNPYGITEVDVPGMIGAYESTRQRRLQELLLARQMKVEDRKLEREQNMLTVLSRFRTPGSPAPVATGTEGAAAAQAPSTAIPPPGGPPVQNGPAEATGAPALPPTSWVGTNQEVLSQLLTIDPEEGIKYLTAFRQMDAGQVKEVKDRNAAIAQAAQYLKGIPAAQRPAELQRIAPTLLELGVPQESIARADLSDPGLNRLVAMGRDVEKLIEDTRDRWMPVGEGGALRVDAFGNPVGAGNPYASGGFVPPQSAPETGDGSFRVVGVPGDSETSAYRTPERNREVGGVPNSYHTRRDASGNAMASDRVPPQGMSMAAYAAELKRLNPSLDVINEGDHVHLEPRGSAQARAPAPPPGFVLDR